MARSISSTWSRPRATRLSVMTYRLTSSGRNDLLPLAGEPVDLTLHAAHLLDDRRRPGVVGPEPRIGQLLLQPRPLSLQLLELALDLRQPGLGSRRRWRATLRLRRCVRPRWGRRDARHSLLPLAVPRVVPGEAPHPPVAD